MGSPADDWPEPARLLLERAAARHGGWERWERLEEVRLRLVSLGGLIPAGKGIGRTFPRPSRAAVRPPAWETRFLDYPTEGTDGVFSGGDVRLVDPQGRIVEQSLSHRASFRGLRKWRRWRPLDALYFFGYALATYLSVPFLLARTKLVGHDPRRRWLTVDFPDGLDSHGRRQRFHFDEEGLLVRHDYRAEILSAVATGSHFSSGYVEAGGMPFASRRWVTLRIGGTAVPLTVLATELADFEARFRT